jgi:hypothetical protein
MAWARPIRWEILAKGVLPSKRAVKLFAYRFAI